MTSPTNTDIIEVYQEVHETVVYEVKCVGCGEYFEDTECMKDAKLECVCGVTMRVVE